MSKLNALLLAAAVALGSGIAGAKLPAPSPEAKAKADETKAKATAAAEVEKANLAKAQDHVAARYISEQKAKGVTVKPTPIAAPAAAATPASATPAAASPGRPGEKAEAHSAPADPKGDSQMGGKVAEKKSQDGANPPK